MKKAAIIPAMALFSVMLTSCFLYPDLTLKNPEPDKFDTLEEGFFYAKNMTDNAKNMLHYGFYQLKAEMLYEGEKCEIWAEIGSGVTLAQAEDIAREYDDNIRQKIVDAFSVEQFSGNYEGVTYYFDDILDYANWLAGRDNKKLTILLLDIRDGFDPDKETDAYVAGYFYSGNFFSEGKINDSNFSNGRDMIYVDTSPGLETESRRSQVYATFAHELQHLVNFVTCFLLDKDYTDVWVNEGLSAYAEHLYLGMPPQDRCDWLLSPGNTIKTGNNFFVWGNHSDNQYAILDDYATVYLFFRWLYLQANTGLQASIFYDITTSKYPDYQAITDVARKIDYSWYSWENLLRTWLAANYYPENAVYGYKDDSYLQSIIKIDPIAGNAVSLYPGEGVYSIINNNFTPATGGTNIRYAGFAVNAFTPDVYPPYNGNVLLTFNVNTNNKARAETGYLTGVSPSPAASRTAVENSRPGKWTGPYVIDAGDIVGRDQERLKSRVLR
jgi:hypothetical protein